MADQAYFGDDEANKERDKAEEIFEKLTSNEFKTKEEVEAALKDDNPQARFHRQRKLLWHLINSATAKIDQNLLKGKSILQKVDGEPRHTTSKLSNSTLT